MNQIIQHYEKFWKTFSGGDAYERDNVFPQIFSKGEVVLDLACGDGKSTAKISDITQNIVSGLEISPKAASLAKKIGINCKVGDVQDKFPFPDQKFDVVFWGDNIEHIFSPLSALSEIKRVLTPNGRVIISTPNTAYWRYRLYYFIHGQLPDTEFDNQPQWNWSHIRFFNIQILKKFLAENNFKVTRIWGINRRKVDNILTRFFPSLFGMIIVIEAIKESQL